jgi:hypothetical protein
MADAGCNIRRFALLRTTFQLILASLAMTIAISYCTSLSRLLSDSLDPDTGGLAFFSLLVTYLMLSLFFSVFSVKWINTNLKMVLFTYFTAALMFSIVKSIKIVMLANFTELLIILLGKFIFWLLMFFPLFFLVATTFEVIIEILNSLNKRN